MVVEVLAMETEFYSGIKAVNQPKTFRLMKKLPETVPRCGVIKL
jgi:hypothetical protein